MCNVEIGQHNKLQSSIDSVVSFGLKKNFF